MIHTSITEIQRQVLIHAIDCANGVIDWYPETVRGGARIRVIAALEQRKLVTTDGDNGWQVTQTGYLAIGRDKPAKTALVPTVPPAAMDVRLSDNEARWAAENQTAAKRLLRVGVEGKPRTRDNSKQALLLAMLRREGGATIAQLTEATGWLSHTVRGTLAGVVKKKLGLALTSDKPEGGERIYRIH